MHSRVRRLGARGVGARGLAGTGRVAGDVEEIVDDLEREPEMGAVIRERVDDIGLRARCLGADTT